MIYAIDPGPEQSALVVFDTDRQAVPYACIKPNVEILGMLTGRATQESLVVEQIASFGMAVGAEVFETVFWSGRFVEAWPGAWYRVKRHEVKTHLCHTQAAKDANIRQAIIDRFGPGKERAIGTKKAPGPLYGIKGDEWSALAVALTWTDQHAPQVARVS